MLQFESSLTKNCIARRYPLLPFTLNSLSLNVLLIMPPSHTEFCSPRQKWGPTFPWCAAETECCPPDNKPVTELHSELDSKSHLDIRVWLIVCCLLCLSAGGVLRHLAEVWLGPEHLPPRPPQLLLPPLGLRQFRLDLVQHISRALTSHGGTHWGRNFWHGLEILRLQ